MKDIRNYAKAAAETINRDYSRLEAEVVERVKINDNVLVGVEVRRKDIEGIAMAIYVNDFCEHGVCAAECAYKIAEIALRETGKEIGSFGEQIETWETVKDRIAIRLVETKRNTRYLEDKVRKELDNGLSVMFDAVNGDFRAPITEKLAETFGCDFDKLYRAAQENDIVHPYFSAISMDENENILETETAGAEMLVLRDGFFRNFGAAAICYEGVGERIRKIIGDYWLLPSSLHEWMIVPKSMGKDVEELKGLVAFANRNVVKAEDVLSDDVFEWTDGRLQRVA